MLPLPMLAGIRFEAYEIRNLALIVFGSVFFFVYKLVSRCLRHRIRKLKIQKGIVSAGPKSGGSAKWIRSIYMAVGLLLASGALAWYTIVFHDGLGSNAGPFLMFILPLSCAGIAYFFRGILKRRNHLAKLALSHGVPFEVICPPQKRWALPLAIGLPLLIYAVAMFLLCMAMNSGSQETGMSIIIAGVVGGVFFLYGLIMCVALGRNRRRAARISVGAASQPAQPQQPEAQTT